MRQHDGPLAFRHARVSQIEIMLCGHYNRKYGAPGPVRNPPGTHLFQKRIIIYYYTGYERNNNRPRAALPRTRSSFDRSLNTYASPDPHPHVFLYFLLFSSYLRSSADRRNFVCRSMMPVLTIDALTRIETRHAFDRDRLQEIYRRCTMSFYGEKFRLRSYDRPVCRRDLGIPGDRPVGS